MRSGQADDVAVEWEVARPEFPVRFPGVGIAGFADRGTTPFAHWAIPHPSVMLAVDFGPGHLDVSGPDGRSHRDPVVGLGCGAVRVRGENVRCVQIRLSPIAVHSVLGVPSSELDGAIVDLEDLWGTQTELLRERLTEAASWSERLTIMDNHLPARYTDRPVDPEIARVWGRMITASGGARVEDLAADVGWSRKRLWTRFRHQIGPSPKRAARLIRFDHAVHQLAAGVEPARVAAAGGYTDQSHLHRDVRMFTGTTPASMPHQPWLAVDGTAWAATPSRH